MTTMSIDSLDILQTTNLGFFRKLLNVGFPSSPFHSDENIREAGAFSPLKMHTSIATKCFRNIASGMKNTFLVGCSRAFSSGVHFLSAKWKGPE